MKQLGFFLLVFFFISNANAQSKPDTLVVKTLIYCDHCMQCESCASRIEKNLLLTPGVKGVVLDEKAMTITVVYNKKKTNPDKIRKAISKSGYDADDVKADPKGVSKLDGCCRKKG